jgi:hypothetical protein
MKKYRLSSRATRLPIEPLSSPSDAGAHCPVDKEDRNQRRTLCYGIRLAGIDHDLRGMLRVIIIGRFTRTVRSNLCNPFPTTINVPRGQRHYPTRESLDQALRLHAKP